MDIPNWDQAGGDTNAGGPTGVPDPNNPGYDTAGFPLSTTGPGGITLGQTIGTPWNLPTTPQYPGQPTVPNVTVGGQPIYSGSPAPAGADTGAGGADTGGSLTGVLAPFSEQAPSFPSIPAFTPPPAFSYQDFKPPSIGEAFDDPTYQWERGQTLDALNRDAAAKGILNDSGTARAFLDLGNNIAATRVGDVYGRAFQTYGMNRQNAVDTYNTNYKTQYTDPYAINRQTQYIDPYTAAFNAWQQRGNFYLNNQGTASNALLNFGNLA